MYSLRPCRLMLVATMFTYWREFAATSWWARAKMMGEFTLLTIAAVTGSRNSFGCRGGRDLQPASRLNATSMGMRFRISEIDSVADADKQPRRVADLEARGILAQLGPAFDLQYMTMPLVVDVSVRSIEDRRKAGVSDLALKQVARACAPGTKLGVT